MRFFKKLTVYVCIAVLTAGMIPTYAFASDAVLSDAVETVDYTEEEDAAEEIIEAAEESAEEPQETGETAAAAENAEEEDLQETENPQETEVAEASDPVIEETPEQSGTEETLITEEAEETDVRSNEDQTDIPSDETEESQTCLHDAGTHIEGAKEATSTEEGYTGDTVCDACGEIISYGEAIPVLGKTDIAGLEISLEYTSVVYDGTEKTPAVTVNNGSEVLVKDTDYSVAYSDNINAGTVDVTVAGQGEYCGETTLQFSIAKAPQRPVVTLSKSTITVNGSASVSAEGIGSITYTSSNTARAEVSADGTITVKKAGIVKITAKAAGDSNHKAKSVSVKLTIVPEKTKLTAAYNITKGIKLTWNKADGASGYYIYRSENGTDYTLIRTLISGSTVAATDKTAVSGKYYYYKIVPYKGNVTGAESAVRSLYRLDRPEVTLENPASGKILVSWTRVAGADGYIISYGNSDSEETLVIENGGKTAKNISGLTNGRKYHVRVTAYKEADGAKTYSLKSLKAVVSVKENVISITGTGKNRTLELRNPAPSIKSMRVAVWSTENEQDDLVWYTMVKTDGVWSVSGITDLLISSGKCAAHFYTGKTFVAGKVFEVDASELPERVTLSGTGSMRTIVVKKVPSGITGVKAGVWSKENGRDDIVWYTLTKTAKGNWTGQLSLSVVEDPGKCVVRCYTGGDISLGSAAFTVTDEELSTAVNSRITDYANAILSSVGQSLYNAYAWAVNNISYQSIVTPMTVPNSGSYAGFNRQELYFAYAYNVRMGNCFCYAATFYWLSRQLGYQSRLMECKYVHDSGEIRPHGWVEIDMDGGTYIFDPEIEHVSGQSGWKRTYSNGVLNYRPDLAAY